MTSLAMTASATGALILERLPQVRARTGMCRSSLYRAIASGDFPAPIKLGERASAWDARAVDRWILARIAARDAKAGV